MKTYLRGTHLTEHFTFVEFVRSIDAERHAIENVPTEKQIENGIFLARELLEPARAILGVPMVPVSWFRSLRVNDLVGGERTSLHLEGFACDFIPVSLDLVVAMKRLVDSKLQFEELVLESSWLHLGYRQTLSRETWIAEFHKGRRPSYRPYVLEGVTV